MLSGIPHGFKISRNFISFCMLTFYFYMTYTTEGKGDTGRII